MKTILFLSLLISGVANAYFPGAYEGYTNPVSDASMLPVLGNTDGDVRIAQDTKALYAYDVLSTNWILIASPAAATAITALTGDVHCTGPGACVSTIQPNVISNSKLAQIPALSVKGNNTGSTANVSDVLMSALPISTAAQTALNLKANSSSISTVGFTGLYDDLLSTGTGVTPGTYTSTNLTVGADGRITAASNGSGGGGTWGSITGLLSNQTDLQTAINAKENTLGFTPENTVNKSTDTNLGISDILFPTQNATKSYIDTLYSTTVSGIPNSNATSAVAVSSASTTFVEVMTSTVTTTQANIIHGVGSFNLTTSTAASIAGVRVVLETPEISLFTTVADVASSLNNTYFTFTKTTGAFYGWYNVGGAGVDPVPGGTGIPIAISVNATAAQVATATISALSTHGGLSVVGQPSQFKVQNLIGGVVTDSTAGTSTFALSVTQQGVATSNGTNINQSLVLTTDTYNATAQHFFTAPSAGVYYVKGQIQRVSGTGTANFTRGAVWGQAQQSVISPLTPSRVLYVAKNGAVNGNGSFNSPFLTIQAAINKAQETSDFNAPIAILVAPGNGSVTYTENLTISKGGLSILAMGSTGFKSVNTSIGGFVTVNMTGSNLFLSMQGLEINAPSGTAAITSIGSVTQRIFLEGMVINSNSATGRAISCTNPLSTITVINSEVKAGTSAGPNTSPVLMTAGTLILTGVDTADRKSSNDGTAITLDASAVTINGGSVSGSINKINNTGVLILDKGVQVSSGVNPSVILQASAGTGFTNVYSATINSTASNVATGGETITLGRVSYGLSANGIDPLVNGGAGPAFYLSDIRAKYYSAIPADWATSPPTNVNDALNRMSALLKTLNGGVPIP